MYRVYEILYNRITSLNNIKTFTYVYVFMIMYNTYFKTNVFCKLLAIQLAFSISIEHIGKEPKLSLNNRFNVKKIDYKIRFQ